jgi:hypothetical protein
LEFDFDPGVTSLTGLIAGVEPLRDDTLEAEAADGVLDLRRRAGERVRVEDR